MKFIPDYRVCYKGKFYECGEELDIDPSDAEEMSEHGEIVDETVEQLVDSPAEESAEKISDEVDAEDVPAEETHIEDKPKRGRPAKEDK